MEDRLYDLAVVVNSLKKRCENGFLSNNWCESGSH